MKTRGRRQSGNVLDLTDPRTKRTYDISVSSRQASDRVQRNLAKDSIQAERIPKRMVGFDSHDMEKSVGLKRAVRKLKSLPMKKR